MLYYVVIIKFLKLKEPSYKNQLFLGTYNLFLYYLRFFVIILCYLRFFVIMLRVTKKKKGKRDTNSPVDNL